MIFYGITGLIILISAWILEAKANKEKKVNINPQFSALYVLASFCLTIYSYTLNDAIFLVLNVIVTILSAIPLYYYITNLPMLKHIIYNFRRNIRG
jgi:hypothetical protein